MPCPTICGCISNNHNHNSTANSLIVIFRGNHLKGLTITISVDSVHNLLFLCLPCSLMTSEKNPQIVFNLCVVESPRSSIFLFFFQTARFLIKLLPTVLSSNDEIHFKFTFFTFFPSQAGSLSFSNTWLVQKGFGGNETKLDGLSLFVDDTDSAAAFFSVVFSSLFCLFLCSSYHYMTIA